MPSEIIPPLNSSRRFGIKVILHADSKRIETEYLDGSFKFLKLSWEFIEKDNLGCDVKFLLVLSLNRGYFKRLWVFF